MSRSTKSTGIVLRSALTGESFLKIDLLSPEDGVFLCLKRISSKNPTKDRPDLFDTAEVTLEASKQGNLQFVGEYRVLERRVQIGQSYRSLKYASDFAAIVAENGPHMADSETLFSLTERTLHAFTEQKAPEVIFLKAVYLLLKDEGYPIKETWWSRLPMDLKPIAKHLLNQPTPATLSQAHRETIDRLNRNLCLWLSYETDLQLPCTIQAGTTY